MKERIIKKLKENLAISHLQVINKSNLHSGHLENTNNGDTHFEIVIDSEELRNKRIIEAHRIVKSLLKEEFEKNGLHSLSIKLVKS